MSDCMNRWWPARVHPLHDMPVQFQSRQRSVGEFLVHFFGSYDYAFVHRGQVFNYLEGVIHSIVVFPWFFLIDFIDVEKKIKIDF